MKFDPPLSAEKQDAIECAFRDHSHQQRCLGMAEHGTDMRVHQPGNMLCNTRPAVLDDRQLAARNCIMGAVKPDGVTEQQIHRVRSIGRQTLRGAAVRCRPSTEHRLRITAPAEWRPAAPSYSRTLVRN
eukprot:COSAG01_NODE_5819_length_4014_cov_5.567561_5_plen_128_part_01